MVSPASITALLRVSLALQGPRRDRYLARAERLLPARTGIRRAPRGLRVDVAVRSQRLLYYYFYNVLRSFRASPLFGRMRRTLGPGDLFLDVGANLGLYALLARELGAEAWLFEPEPVHLAYLRRNEARLGRVFGVAVSDAEGPRAFHVAGDRNPAASSVMAAAPGDATYTGTIRVEGAPLDSLVPAAGDRRRVAMVKVDVEGGEAAAVAGMRGVLADAGRPELWCEVRGPGSGRSPDSWRAVDQLLRPLGYRPYLCDGRSVSVFEPEDPPPVFDLLFLPR